MNFVPLCRGHHREVHRGDEPVWWLKMRINPMTPARTLWLKTHPLPKAETTEAIEHVGSDRNHTDNQLQNAAGDKRVHAGLMAR